ncbi:MAG: sigma 54-interacting transcriptional regulator [Proteobacteria bacterium]|nr:sigma 54-interacting transcriptional regulator [Pseudomonadota bacterium]
MAYLRQNEHNDFRNMTVGFYIIQRGRFSHVNDQLADLLGFENPDQLIGTSVLNRVHPDDRNLFKSGKSKDTKRDNARPFALRMLKKDDGHVWVIMKGADTVHEDKPATVGCLIDISSFREIEDALSKYRSIIDEVEDAVAETDLSGNITFSNATGCRIWGGSMVNKNFRCYMDEKTARFVHQAYHHVFKTREPGKNIIYEIIRKDGQRRTVEDSVSLIQNRDGEITGFRTVSRDITERKEKEKALAEHRALLEAIFRSVKDAIITVDSELKVIQANTSAETICSLNSRKAVGKLFPQCFDQCRNACFEILKKTLAKKNTIKEYLVECGSEKNPHQIVSVSSSPLLDPSENFMGAVLVIRDITLLQDLERELRERHQYQNIIGKSKKMQDIYSLSEDLSNLDTTVLVTGESGTGKELIARALHYTGHRSFKPFITVNCSALAEGLLESELFGHVKGAFTGAINNREGRFQAADGGTILLDEIGDISPFIQLKLLRVLQEKEFERVGETTPHKVDVRIIACTNKDLYGKVKRGEFREDLYYRLKVVEIHIPPLRERQEDIPLLVDHFCNSFQKRFKKNVEGVSTDVLARFMDYAWPGNVRELEHVIERAFILCRGNSITFDHLPKEIRNCKVPPGAIIEATHQKNPRNDQDIFAALNKTFWNKTKAAKLLGVSRQTLYRKIREYNIGE